MEFDYFEWIKDVVVRESFAVILTRFVPMFSVGIGFNQFVREFDDCYFWDE
jgi:hypothetical protein